MKRLTAPLVFIVVLLLMVGVGFIGTARAQDWPPNPVCGTINQDGDLCIVGSNPPSAYEIEAMPRCPDNPGVCCFEPGRNCSSSIPTAVVGCGTIVSQEGVPHCNIDGRMLTLGPQAEPQDPVARCDSDRSVCCTVDAMNQCPEGTGDDDQSHFYLCDQIPESNEARSLCQSCHDNEEGVWTAVGCISQNPTNILEALLTTGITIAGGVALLMILGAGFIFSTSAGDPKKIDQAKELITSAVVGLIFIIFSVTILQYIGVTILRIPGFGG